jgi:hypothetical protein
VLPMPAAERPSAATAPGSSNQPGAEQALRAAAESVGSCLPIEATAAEVALMAGPRPGTADTPPGQWRTIAAFPLG